MFDKNLVIIFLLSDFVVREEMVERGTNRLDTGESGQRANSLYFLILVSDGYLWFSMRVSYVNMHVKH